MCFTIPFAVVLLEMDKEGVLVQNRITYRRWYSLKLFNRSQYKVFIIITIYYVQKLALQTFRKFLLQSGLRSIVNWNNVPASLCNILLAWNIYTAIWRETMSKWSKRNKGWVILLKIHKGLRLPALTVQFQLLDTDFKPLSNLRLNSKSTRPRLTQLSSQLKWRYLLKRTQ